MSVTNQRHAVQRGRKVIGRTNSAPVWVTALLDDEEESEEERRLTLEGIQAIDAGDLVSDEEMRLRYGL